MRTEYGRFAWINGCRGGSTCRRSTRTCVACNRGLPRPATDARRRIGQADDLAAGRIGPAGINGDRAWVADGMTDGAQADEAMDIDTAGPETSGITRSTAIAQLCSWVAGTTTPNDIRLMEIRMTTEHDGSAVNKALTTRHLAMLRAVADGRAELTSSSIPDLYVDGRCCTDHAASALLIAAGLIDRADACDRETPAAGRVPARVTLAGAALLAELAAKGATAGRNAA